VDIISYRELQQKDEIMMLMDLAFWWPMSPRDFDELLNMDIRLRNGPVGFCAVKDGRLAGYVGVMDIPTKTVRGETEIVGGIWCVATNPDFSRQGICKRLMEEAHNYFRRQKYHFSFLCTSRTIIAHRIYERLRYTEVEYVNELSSVYKVLDKAEPVEKKIGTVLDPEKIYRIYEKFVENKTGFVARQRDFVTLFAMRKRFDGKKSIQREQGYALVTESQNVIKVQDIVALNDAVYGELIDQIEQIAKSGVINRAVTDERLVSIYESKGYQAQRGDDSVLMVKNLTDASIDKVYGDSFFIGPLDWF
jgi:ribosomal protein S18 acetylase RimI-like enzyme